MKCHSHCLIRTLILSRLFVITRIRSLAEQIKHSSHIHDISDANVEANISSYLNKYKKKHYKGHKREGFEITGVSSFSL